ncbi:MAG: inositol monophosphatase family protein, partial [Gammaproteobacteria bacterium]
LADAGRAATLPYFRRGVAVENKGDDSPVTAADRGCEKALRALLAAQYPQHAVYGEEFGGDLSAAQNGFAWILDPIDGTRSFISGSRQYCTLIGLAHNGAPVLGVIDMPALDERWMGCDAPEMRRAEFNGKACAASGREELSDAVFATTTLGVTEDSRDTALRRLCRAAGQVRLGGDASAFGSLAAGFLDGAADYEMACYDWMPLFPIIRAAGGTISDWAGNTPKLDGQKTGIVAASTAALHRRALGALGDF